MPTRAIKAIFFTRFHHEKGSRVLHQVPEGSITRSSSPSALSTPLFDFDSVTTYLIPTQEFCDRLLTFCTNRHRVIGYPVCIREGKYSRNEYIFNFAMVVEEGVSDWTSYGEVVKKLGRLLRGLEEQGGFLSREEEGVWGDEGGHDLAYGPDLGAGWTISGNSGYGGGFEGSKVYALCEMVLEDLNNYAECMIPIDESNTINLKLFPTHPPPPPIHSYQVPLLTISLSSLTSPISSDLTLERILPYINGINSVGRIALLADTDLSLTRKAVQHLIFYGCLILLDIFSFGAIYAPTAEIGGFVSEKVVQEECARYVRVPRTRLGRRGTKMGSESDRSRDRDSVSSEAGPSDISISSTLNPRSEFDLDNPYSSSTQNLLPDDDEEEFKISHMDLITLYTSLRQGLTLKNWVLENLDLLVGIDIRRFITFGIIKGFLYRVHRYAISTSTSSTALPMPVAPPASLPSDITNQRDPEHATIRGHHLQQSQPYLPPHLSHKPSLASTMNTFTPGRAGAEEMTRLESILSDDREREQLPLVKFLDGMHSFDEICMEVGASEKLVEEKLKEMMGSDVVFFWR